MASSEDEPKTMQQLAWRLRSGFPNAHDVLFHGTGHGQAIIQSNVMLSARSGWHLISFTTDPNIAVHFATLHVRPTILVFDRIKLTEQFTGAPFQDGEHHEAEFAIWGQNIEPVCDFILDVVGEDRNEERRLKAELVQNRSEFGHVARRKLEGTCSLRHPHTLAECDPDWEQKRKKVLADLSPEALQTLGIT